MDAVLQEEVDENTTTVDTSGVTDPNQETITDVDGNELVVDDLTVEEVAEVQEAVAEQEVKDEAISTVLSDSTVSDNIFADLLPVGLTATTEDRQDYLTQIHVETA